MWINLHMGGRSGAHIPCPLLLPFHGYAELDRVLIWVGQAYPDTWDIVTLVVLVKRVIERQ